MKIFTGLRRGFGSESIGNWTFEFRRRLALPGACRPAAASGDRQPACRRRVCRRRACRRRVCRRRVCRRRVCRRRACRRRVCRRRADRRSQICVRAILNSMYVQLRARRSTGGCHRASVTKHPSPSIVGVPHWLISWFNARAPGPRFQPVSRPSGFCSRAFRASPCHCAVRLAAKCTSGSPMTPGSAPPGNQAMRACSAHRAHRCTPPRAATAQRRRNRIGLRRVRERRGQGVRRRAPAPRSAPPRSARPPTCPDRARTPTLRRRRRVARRTL